MLSLNRNKVFPKNTIIRTKPLTKCIFKIPMDMCFINLSFSPQSLWTIQLLFGGGNDSLHKLIFFYKIKTRVSYNIRRRLFKAFLCNASFCCIAACYLLFKILFLQRHCSSWLASLTLRQSILNTGVYHSTKIPLVWSTTFSGSHMACFNACGGSQVWSPKQDFYEFRLLLQTCLLGSFI